jgi:DNA polymerase III subunit chi
VTLVSFYILEQAAAENHLLFTCRLAEKIYTQGQRLYIHSKSEQQAAQLDDLLWSFRQGSFIPHGLYQTALQEDLPIHIGYDAEPEAGLDVLINLYQEVPVFFSRFPRVAEIVEPGEPGKQAGRERYRFYRDRGYSIESHTISA